MTPVRWLGKQWQAWAGAIESSHREKRETEAVNEALFAGWREGRFEYWRPLVNKEADE